MATAGCRPKRYNSFLFSDEPIPRRTAYRRKQKNSLTSCESRDLQLDSGNIDDCGRSIYDACKNSSAIEEPDVSAKFDSSNVNIGLDNPDNPLFDNSSISNLEAYVSILAFSVKFNLSQTCFQELLNLIKLLLPPCSIPTPKYTFYNKISSLYQNACEVHLYCSKCKCYLCQLSSEKPDKCPQCLHPFVCQENMDKGDFFLYMPLGTQLKALFETKTLFEDLTKRTITQDNNHFKDIVDGVLYRNMPQAYNANDISIQFNIDGVPMFKKSQYDIWPIQCLVNELPPEERQSNVLMCGLWFGAEKPVMNDNFLKPFVKELSTLATTGFQWKTKDAQTLTTKVFLSVCSSDAPARAMIQNFKQYNGKHGCGFCEQEGIRIAKGKGHSRVYPFEENMMIRTHGQTVAYAEQSIDANEAVVGVKGPSSLMLLYPSYDIVKGFVPDYMHCVLLGVTRHVTNLWVETSKETYSLSAKEISLINDRIKALKFPQETTRKLRIIKHAPFWKASEWRSFLQVSPILLQGILKPSIYKHWLLLHHGVMLLLGSNVSNSDISMAESALTKFVKGVTVVYGPQEQTYNIHLLVHLPEAVRNWGPLWATSCFAYESHLGKLKTFHKSSKGLPVQVLTKYLNKTVLEMLTKDSLSNTNVDMFVKNLSNQHYKCKTAVKTDNCVLLGRQHMETYLRMELNALNAVGVSVKENTKEKYNRLVYVGKIFSSKEYCKSFTRADYAVLVGNKYVEISDIVLLNDHVYILGKLLSTKPFKKYDDDVGQLCLNIVQIKAGQNENSFVAFKPSDISMKYIVSNIKKKDVDVTYLIPQLNNAQQ